MKATLRKGPGKRRRHLLPLLMHLRSRLRSRTLVPIRLHHTQERGLEDHLRASLEGVLHLLEAQGAEAEEPASVVGSQDIRSRTAGLDYQSNLHLLQDHQLGVTRWQPYWSRARVGTTII